jgi:hypothetical protein
MQNDNFQIKGVHLDMRIYLLFFVVFAVGSCKDKKKEAEDLRKWNYDRCLKASKMYTDLANSQQWLNDRPQLRTPHSLRDEKNFRDSAALMIDSAKFFMSDEQKQMDKDIEAKVARKMHLDSLYDDSVRHSHSSN